MSLANNSFILAPSLLLTILHLCFNCQFAQIIHPLNIWKDYTISNKSNLYFQVIGSLSLGIGTFDLSFAQLNSSDSLKLLITQKDCSHSFSLQNISYKQTNNFQKSAKVMFYGNASDYQCFEIALLSEDQDFTANISILITFNSYDLALQPYQFVSFNIPTKFEKRFIYNFKYPQVDLFLITIKTNLSSNYLQNLKVRLINNEGICIKYPNKVTSLGLWLCNILEPEGVLSFSVYNQEASSSLELMINDFKPQEINTNLEAQFNSSIPGLGSIFLTNISQIGILKVKAMSDEDKYFNISISNSVYGLLVTLGQNQNQLTLFDFVRDNQGSIYALNKKVGTPWYFFVPESKANTFILNSKFIKQMSINIDSEAIYYIDPNIYEYQHIRLHLGKRDLLEKYDAVLSAERSDSPANLYYNANFNEIISPLSLSQNIYRKQAYLSGKNKSEVSLSFVLGSYDSSAYLVIQVFNKGYYKLRVTKVNSTSSFQNTLIFTFLIYLVFFLLFCLFRMYKSLKRNVEFRDGHNNIPVGIQIQETEFIIGTNHFQILIEKGNLAQYTKMISALNVLKEKEERERIKKTEQANDRSKQVEQDQDLNNTSFVDEDERCNICYDSRKTIKFKPCCHECACSLCALNIIQISPKCPLCREEIIEVEICKTIEGK